MASNRNPYALGGTMIDKTWKLTMDICMGVALYVTAVGSLNWLQTKLIRHIR